MTADQSLTQPRRQQLTASEFINFLNASLTGSFPPFTQPYGNYESAVVFKNIEVSEQIVIGNRIFAHSPIVLIDSVFTNIIFNGCTLYNDFIIDGGDFKDKIEIQAGTFSGDFTIKNGTFDVIRIENGTFNKDFQISGGIFNKSFIILGGIFNKNFTIDNGNFITNFSITGNPVFNIFQIFGGLFHQSLLISGGIFSSNFYFQGGIFLISVDIIGGNFKEYFSVHGNTNIKSLIVQGGNFEKALNINGGYIHSIEISHISTKIPFTIYREATINILLFRDDIPKDSTIRISGNFYQIAFINSQIQGAVFLIDTSFTNTLYKPEKSTDIDISENVNHPEILIHRCDMGKTTLINCDLSGFHLNFRSSKITEMFVTGSQMPMRINTVNNINKPDYLQQQLGFSQIKKIYESRGDRVGANQYYAKEMDAYYATLSCINDFGEWVNLGLNKFSTKYGQSWLRGSGTTLLISAIFYGAYCWLLGYWPALPTGDHFNVFSHVFSYFLEFLNPIHKADYVAEQLLGEKAYVNGWARFTEGTSRVFIAYFVYQLIQAFRKHGKVSG